ncbi:hypothetical protein OG824_05355 [Streptomyces prunicolor]|nr:hypothetical protein [Streptomyces prunicolor]
MTDLAEREAAHADGPRGGEPVPGRGLYAMTDVTALQQQMVNLFGPVAVSVPGSGSVPG